MTKLIIGSHSQKLGKKLCDYLKLDHIKAKISCFEDGELQVRLENNLENENVLIVQATSKPVHDAIMELLLLIDASKRAGAKYVAVLMPYFAYSRQNCPTSMNEPLSAQLMVKLLQAAGVDKVITIDLHAKNIESFFTCPVHHLKTTEFFAGFLTPARNLMIVSPDKGGKERAQKLAEYLNIPCAIIFKTRNIDGTCKMITINAEIKGYDCILIDDIIDTGSTLCKASEFLVQKGALSVRAMVTHGIFSGSAVNGIENSSLDCVMVTNTIDPKSVSSKIQILDVSTFIAEQLKRIRVI